MRPVWPVVPAPTTQVPLGTKTQGTVQLDKNSGTVCMHCLVGDKTQVMHTTVGWSDFEERKCYTFYVVPNTVVVGPQFQNFMS